MWLSRLMEDGEGQRAGERDSVCMVGSPIVDRCRMITQLLTMRHGANNTEFAWEGREARVCDWRRKTVFKVFAGRELVQHGYVTDWGW